MLVEDRFGFEARFMCLDLNVLTASIFSIVKYTLIDFFYKQLVLQDITQ